MATIGLATTPAYAGVGDLVTLTATVKDVTGTLAAATMAIAVTKPDGSAASPSAPATSSTGIYTSAVAIDTAGVWTYVWTASGTQVAVESDQFEVRAQAVYVVSLEELKKQLNKTDSADDAELRTYLAASTRYVEKEIGGPVSVQTFTERQFIIGQTVIPRRRPLVSVTSITPDFTSTALASTSYTADTDVNQIFFYYLVYTGWHTLVYRAGRASPTENIRLAGMIVAQHLWDTQNGFAGRRNADDFVQSGLGFAVPRRAAELLGAGDAIGGIS